MTEDLRRAWDKAVRSANLRNRIPGRMGHANGSIMVAARPGYVYVRLSAEGNQTVAIARNEGAPRIYDLPIWLEQEYNTYVVTGVDIVRLEMSTGSGGGTSVMPGGVGYHTHRLGSGYEYEVEALRLEMGRVRPHSGMTVYINPFRYFYNGSWETFLGGTLDLTSNKPATGWAWVLVGVNPATNTAVATTGTAYPLSTPLTRDMIDNISFGSYIPLAGIKVKSGDSALTDITRYMDAHGWFVGGSGAYSDTNDDEKAKVSANDTTAGYLNGKLVAGSNITLTENNDAGNETLTIAASGGGGSGLYADYINIREEQAAGTQSGTFTSGAWRTRTLNTEHADTGNHATLSSNQITLAAGTYRCLIRCPATYVNGHKARLQNVTDGTTTLVGTSAYTTAGDTGVTTTESIIAGRFTIASSKTFEVQHYCQTTRATHGFGISGISVATEIYTLCEFWKEA